MQSTEEYFNGNDLAISVFNNKYALPKGNRSEYPEEAVNRVVRHLLEFEKDKSIGNKWIETWMNGDWRFGGSIFTIGNTENPKQSTANCTTVVIEDDTLEAIFKTAYDIAKCAAYRQGIGVDISKLRPRGAKLNNSAKVSDGSIHWLDFISQLANYVGQNARRPALLGAINIYHPDIFEFITAKDDLTRLNNMNISVQIPDSFMYAVMKDRSVSLQFNRKVYKTVKAVDLLKMIAEHAYNYGEPGLQFITLMKKHSMQEAVGFPIQNVNACCLPGYEIINTPRGNFTISQLKDTKNFEVLTDEGIATVTEVIQQPEMKQCVEITAINTINNQSTVLHVTYDHKIKLPNGDFLQAIYLAPGLQIQGLDGIYTIESICLIGKEVVYDLINSTTGTFSANKIIVSNSEKPLPNHGVCNLCSINLGNLSTTNWQRQLDRLVPPIVRFMDDVTSYELTYNKSPIPEQKYTVKNLREIGVGVTNVHEYLLKHNAPYGSRKGNYLLEEVISYIAKLVWIESEKLAAERGSFPAFDRKKLRNSEYYNFMCKEVHEPKGLRFAANMSIAPAGSISLILPKPPVSQGIEPAIGFAYWRKTRVENKDYDYYFVLVDKLKQALLEKIDSDFQREFIQQTVRGSVKDNDGKIGRIVLKMVEQYGLDKVFKGAHDIDINDKLDLLSRIQPWIDAGISTTFNLRKDYPNYLLPKFFCDAWQKGIKCLSVYREGSRDDILTFTPPKKKKKEDEGVRPHKITYTFAPRRPDSLPCDIHKVIVKGKKYVVFVGKLNDIPYEVFAGEIQEIDIPTTATNGVIKKRKARVYDLHIEMERKQTVIEDIVKTFNNKEYADLTLSISRELRHGIPIYFIVDGLKKTEGSVTDFSKVLARVLSKYNGHIPSYAKKAHICPVCGEPLTPIGGCERCMNCNYSKCE